MDLLQKTPEFSGKPEQWYRWAKTFLCRATLRGYKKVILRKDGDEEEWPKNEWDLLNELAYAELMIGCQDDMCFNIIDGSRSNLFPEGDAGLAWKRLNEKFEPKSSSNLVTIKREFSLCALKRERDPEDWINQLLMMNRRLEGMGYSMTEMEIIIHILNNLPKEYESVVEGIEGDLDNSLNVDLEKVKNKLRAKYARIKVQPARSLGRISEGAFYAGQEGFKGNCRKCGEYGHKAALCPQKREEMKCNYCKFKGHTEDYCRKKKRDKESGQMEVLMALEEPEEDILEISEPTDGEDEGLLMMEQDYPGQVWVGDSGATCHMTNSEEGLIDWKPIKQGVKMGNGDILEATRIGIMNIKYKDPDSKQEVFFELRGVKLVPGLCKKLFSVKAALREGAVLGSKGESMIVKKGNVNLVFKETKKGGLLSTILQPKLEIALVTTETKED
jgi:gag-polypeptide of LTR copia-type